MSGGAARDGAESNATLAVVIVAVISAVGCGSLQFNSGSAGGTGTATSFDHDGVDAKDPDRPTEASEGLEGYLRSPENIAISAPVNGTDGADSSDSLTISAPPGTLVWNEDAGKPTLTAAWVAYQALIDGAKVGAATSQPLAAELIEEVEVGGDGSFTFSVVDSAEHDNEVLILSLDAKINDGDASEILVRGTPAAMPRSIVTMLLGTTPFVPLSLDSWSSVAAGLSGGTSSGFALRSVSGNGSFRVSLAVDAPATFWNDTVGVEVRRTIGSKAGLDCDGDALVVGTVSSAEDALEERLPGEQREIFYLGCARLRDGTVVPGDALRVSLK